MICLVMVSYAWGGGGGDWNPWGGICPPVPPPGLNPVWASVCTYNG